jgi:hypothetical protein
MKIIIRIVIRFQFRELRYSKSELIVIRIKRDLNFGQSSLSQGIRDNVIDGNLMVVQRRNHDPLTTTVRGALSLVRTCEKRRGKRKHESREQSNYFFHSCFSFWVLSLPLRRIC